MTDDLVTKLMSQVGDDVQKIYDHEALFKAAAARIRELEAAQDPDALLVTYLNGFEDGKAKTPAPVTVQEAAQVLVDKFENPFDHPDMNKGDIDWQRVWGAFWEEANHRDAPAAIAEALRALAGQGGK